MMCDNQVRSEVTSQLRQGYSRSCPNSPSFSSFPSKILQTKQTLPPSLHGLPHCHVFSLVSHYIWASFHTPYCTSEVRFTFYHFIHSTILPLPSEYIKFSPSLEKPEKQRSFRLYAVLSFSLPCMLFNNKTVLNDGRDHVDCHCFNYCCVTINGHKKIYKNN